MLFVNLSLWQESFDVQITDIVLFVLFIRTFTCPACGTSVDPSAKLAVSYLLVYS